MPPPILRALRSTIAGNRPTGRTYGEVYANVADGQLGVINQSAAAQDLLGVTNFQTTANYAQGAAALYNGELVTANRALTPAAFNPNNFTSVRQRRNRIVNGNFSMDQFNWGWPTTQVGTGSSKWNYACDRWQSWIGNQSTGASSGGSLTTQIWTPGSLTWGSIGVAPIGPYTATYPGLVGYLAIRSNTAYAMPASNYQAGIGVTIPWWDVIDLCWGTANAQPATLSFMVYSSVVGTWSGAVQSFVGNPSARTYPFTYTIPTANTWTQIAVTIPGDTATTGPWRGTSGNTGLAPCSIFITFDMGASANCRAAANTWITTASGGLLPVGVTGANSLVTTNGALWCIGNVQFERGSIMSPFEVAPETQTQLDCYSYFQTSYVGASAGSVQNTASPGVTTFWNGYMDDLGAGALGGFVPFSPMMTNIPYVATYALQGNGGAITIASNTYGTVPSVSEVSNVGLNGFQVWNMASAFGMMFQWTATGEMGN